MRRVTATTAVYGLIGNPVGHSISPLIHNELARLCDIDMVYETFRVEEEGLKQAIEGAYALNIKGLNVTVPHKQAVIQELKGIDSLAEGIGAVNTLVRMQDGYKGYNTDILGLKRQLKEEGIALKDNNVVILGAGGASRAITFLCAKEGARVFILNRTASKAEQIANDVNNHLHKNAVSAYSLNEYNTLQIKDYLVIQTSSVGLYPKVDEVIIDDCDFYKNAAAGVDIIYNPAKTKFMKMMEQQNKPAYNGLKMLLYQAVSAFELWNDLVVDESNVEKVYNMITKELLVNDR